MSSSSIQASQAKTYTMWVNARLDAAAGSVDSVLSEEFRNGVALSRLVSILTGKEVKFTKTPKMPLHCIENSATAIKALQADGVKLVNISGEDIHSGNVNITLGLIWSLILKYQIMKALASEDSGKEKKDSKESDAAQSAKAKLLSWVAETIAPVTAPTSFRSGWENGVALEALVVKCVGPAGFAVSPVDGAEPASKRLGAALEACALIGVPRFLDVADFEAGAEENSLMTLVSAIQEKSAAAAKRYAEDGVVDPARCASDIRDRLDGAPLAAGSQVSFSVTAVAPSGKPVPGAALHVTVSVGGGPEEAVSLAERAGHPGLFDVTFTCTKGGKLVITAKDRTGAALAGFPYTADVSLGPLTSKTKINNVEWVVSGEGLMRCFTGEAGRFTVKAASEDVPEDALTVTVKSASGILMPARVVAEKKRGTFTVTYAVLTPGPATVEVAILGQQVRGSPFPVAASVGAASPLGCKADLSAFEKVAAGSGKLVKVVLGDVFGNRKPVGGDILFVELVHADGKSRCGASTPGDVVDRGDGSYDILVAIPAGTAPGSYSIEVFLVLEEMSKLKMLSSFASLEKIIQEIETARDGDKIKQAIKAAHSGVFETFHKRQSDTLHALTTRGDKTFCPIATQTFQL